MKRFFTGLLIAAVLGLPCLVPSAEAATQKAHRSHKTHKVHKAHKAVHKTRHAPHKKPLRAH